MYRLSSGSMMGRYLLVMIVISSVQFGLAQNSPHGPLKLLCTDCHTTASWKELAVPMKFNHSTTEFPLAGAHGNVPCLQCHASKRFAGTARDCYTCHRQEYAKALVPNHQVGKFDHDCASCHNTAQWNPSVFQHEKTNFQLVGAHRSVECSACHTNNRFSGLPSECFVCHQQDYNRTAVPNHASAGFSRDCLTCHTMNGWTPSTFDHAKTNFALVGVHRTLECSSCHKNGRFKGVAADCYGCHQREYITTVLPNHAAARFDKDCSTCHTTTAWQPSTFDHNRTGFQLKGAHVSAECSSCHVNGQFKGLATECYPCHQTQFAKTLTPNHTAGQFSHDCLSCHTVSVWRPSTFDHNKTNFQLKGAHVSAECSSCHIGGRFLGTSTDCYACHQQDFTGVVSPNHATGQFSHDCQSCHTSVGWKPSTFSHAQTLFPLSGAHVAAECSSCHLNGKYKGTAVDCYSCHKSENDAVTVPNHLIGQFSHDCLSCHTTSLWKPSTFSHSRTNFPLSGAHVTTDCLFCHKNGQYKGTASDCYSCHQTDFAGAADPNHVAGNFDRNCASCHTTTAWSPATFDHNKTNFKLSGAHSTAQCGSCHAGGKYSGTSAECYSCHRQQYVATTSPAHAAANYPTACISCHSTTAWKPSTFDHTSYFPINAGSKHRPGRWSTCADCHTNPANYKVFSCIDCHEHNKANMDDEHRGKTGYVYESASCYRCHPAGKGD